VLRNSAELPASVVALRYKRLSRWSGGFRASRSHLVARPICHQRDETISGHVYCLSLALLLDYEFQARLPGRFS
jgi:hypothetical protein